MTPRGRALLVLNALCALLLAGWAAWWGVNLSHSRLVHSGRFGFEEAGRLGGDFSHNDLAARKLVAGENPYRVELGGDWGTGRYSYPPVVLALFLWCPLFSPAVTTTAWVVFTGAALALVAVLAWRHRARLGLGRLPLLPCLVWLLFSLPVVFEMERGQYDVLVLLLAWLGWRLAARSETLKSELAAALCLAVVVWIKVYPAPLLLGLAAGRRYRLLLLTMAFGVALGVVPWRATRDFVGAAPATMQAQRATHFRSVRLLAEGRWGELTSDNPTWKHAFRGAQHSLSDYLPGLCQDLGLTRLARVPGLVQSALAAAPLLLWVCLLQYRRGDTDTLLPVLLWLVVLGTFLMPMSWDYNLCLLPVLAIMLYDPRAPWWQQAGLVALTLYLVPWRVEVRALAHLLFVLKILGLLAVTGLLARRFTRPAPVPAAPAGWPGAAPALYRATACPRQGVAPVGES
jgi:hypothetical protein